jgi:hypothetical protein
VRVLNPYVNGEGRSTPSKAQSDEARIQRNGPGRGRFARWHQVYVCRANEERSSNAAVTRCTHRTPGSRAGAPGGGQDRCAEGGPERVSEP